MNTMGGLELSRRVLVVVPYFPPDPKSGGAEMFALALSKGLAMDHGWNVTIVTTAPKQPIGGELLPPCISIHRLSYKFKLSNSPISLDWFRRVREIADAVCPDVVNIHMPVPGLGDIASRAVGNRPILLYYHFGSMRKGSLLLDPVICLYESCLLPLCLRKAEWIACGSRYVKEGILRSFRAKTCIVPPGVDTERFGPAAERVTDPRVLYVGSLNRSDRHKRFSDLLEACRILLAEIPELRLIAVGDGDDRRAYEEMASEMGISGAVDFRGRLEGDALADVYKEAAVLAVPSLRETFGMVITEAMASSLPTVVVNAGGAPEVVDNLTNGLLVPPRNPGAMANALKAVLADPEWAAMLGKAGRNKVVQHLEWPRQVSAMEKVLTAAANARNEGGLVC